MAKYEVVGDSKVGQGQYGSVWLAEKHSDGEASQIVACKMIRFDGTEKGKEAIEQEVSVLSRLRHPNIVEYYDIEWLKYEARLYMEYCDGKNLDDYVKEQWKDKGTNFPSEIEVWRLAFQLSSALAYCHSGILRDATGRFYRDCLDGSEQAWLTILHRDVKPWNVLVKFYGNERPVFKLGDFGFGVILSDESLNMSFSAGTRGYVAPEIKQEDPRWSEKSDIFAFGCTLFYFIQRRPAFLYQIQPSDELPSLPPRFNNELAKFIEKCVAYHPEDRQRAEIIVKEVASRLGKSDLELSSFSYSSGTTSSSQTTTKDQNNPHKDYISFGDTTADIPTTPNETSKSLPIIIPPSTGNKNTKSLVQGSPTVSSSSMDTTRPDSKISSWLAHHGDRDRTEHQRSSVDSFFNLSPAATVSTRSDRIEPTARNELRSLTNAAQSVSVTASHSDRPEWFGMIGKFVVDYEKNPPFESYTPPRHPSIRPYERIPGRIEFIDRRVTQSKMSTLKSMFNVVKNSRTSIEISIEADQCDEYLLEEGTEYFDAAVNSGACKAWLRERLLRNSPKPVFLIVGYLTYLNARVSEKLDGEGSTHASGGLSVSIPSGSGINSLPTRPSDLSSRSRSYEMRGERIQAGFFMPVTPKGSGFELGTMFTHFFWGPQKLPTEY